jgi:2-haloacid dehalogenase
MPRINAIAFDAYGTLFDVHSITALAEQLFPGKGGELSQLWRAKQIEYTQLRSLAGRYKPFWAVTLDALIYAAHSLRLDLDDVRRNRLMGQYACLTPFP